MPFTETMTSRERTMAALNREPVDRPPVANPTNVATVDLMDWWTRRSRTPAATRNWRRSWRLQGTRSLGRRGGAVLHDHPGVVGAGVRDAVGDKDNWPTVRMYRPIWKDSRDVHIPSGFLEHLTTSLSRSPSRF